MSSDSKTSTISDLNPSSVSRTVDDVQGQTDNTSDDANGMFKPIDGDDSVNDVVEVESLCVNCGDNGTTKLLLTIIPFYKEVILSSFSCPHCSYSNSEIQSAGQIDALGVECTLVVTTGEDLNRKVIKSDAASVKIPELEFEIPSSTQKGEITTVEGVIQRARDGLLQDQPVREKNYPDEYQQIQAFIEKLEECIELKRKFTFIVRDISGQSFICPPSSFIPGQSDTPVKIDRFTRSVQEDHLLGIYPELDSNANTDEVINDVNDPEHLADEVQLFATECSHCRAGCHTKMKLVKVPYFKEVIIMATDCDECGHKSNEVKSGGGIEEKGKKITLAVQHVDDLSRDVLKAQTCSIEIPSLELQVGAGTLGGKFTTLEGLLIDIKNQILESHSKFFGDSEPEMKGKLEAFAIKFEKCVALEESFTIIFDDPAGNSYVQNIEAPNDDPQLQIDWYERTFEQNEELGLNDINTENI